MGAGRKTETIIVKEKSQQPSRAENGIDTARNLRSSDLAAVIFGCKHNTIKECFSNFLFGLPAPHFAYIKNIYPGMPLFLFNYSDRKLHGIFEAASHGQLNIKPQAWTEDGSDYTPYAAQVKFHIRMHCQPLVEDQFGPIIAENYHALKLFWFELDQNQTKKLISLFSSSPMPEKQNTLLRGSFGPNAREKQRLEGQIDNGGVKERGTSCLKPSSGLSYSSIVKNMRTCFVQTDQSDIKRGNSVDQSDKVQGAHVVETNIAQCSLNAQQETKDSKNPASESNFSSVDTRQEAQVLNLPAACYSSEWNSSCVSPSLHEEYQPSEFPVDGDLPDEELLFSELNCGSLYEAMANMVITEDNPGEGAAAHSRDANASEIQSLDFHSIIAKLLLEVEDLKGSQSMQARKINFLEQELIESRIEMQHLKNRCKMFESSSLNAEELLLIAGGYDGSLWLSGLDSYSPVQDLKKPLASMNFARSHASAANLNGELYVFGGLHGDLWYDTVESYNPTSNQWISRPSLSQRKGHLAGISLYNKIFAVGGGNGNDYFSEVEMLDVNAAKWIPVRSMLEKRYAPAAEEISGILYAVGGYNGRGYLNSVERLDPREQSWTRLASMTTERAWHSLAVLNDKLIALGGYDGQKMVSTVEVFDPRVGSWMIEGSMNQARGYFGAVVMRDAIYAIGGLNDNGIVLDSVECYKQSQGWQATSLKGIGRRCFFCSVVL